MTDLNLDPIEKRLRYTGYNPWKDDTFALLDEVRRLRERQESHDLANEGIRWKRRALDAEAECERLAAQVERVREYVTALSNSPEHPLEAYHRAMILELLDGDANEFNEEVE